MKGKKHSKVKPSATRSIRNLDENVDFSMLFGAGEQPGANNNFAAMLENNASTEDFRAALREKAAGLNTYDADHKYYSYPHPQAELDLHGMNTNEAAFHTENFIRSAHFKGIPAVRIITGKGLHSDGEGVLRDATELLILDLKRQEVVQGLRWEKKQKQKSGAVTVFLAGRQR